MAKYKYDGKEYDLDQVIEASKKGLDTYISTHKVNDSKFRDAVLDLLDQMRAGNSTESSNKTMHFNNNFGETRPDGLFRDRYKNNRHYNQGVAYILNTLSGMSPYEEPKPEEKPKTKLSAAIIGNDIITRLGDTSTLDDSYKRAAERDAWNYVLNKYKWDQPDLYEIEGPHTLSELQGFINNGITALGTTNNINDDNYYYSRFGIQSPFYKAPTEQPATNNPLDTIKQRVLSLGFNDSDWNRLLPIFQAKGLSELGIDNNTIATMINTNEHHSEQPKPSSVQQSSQVRAKNTTTSNQFKINSYNDAKAFIQKNIKNLKNPNWSTVDNYVANLVRQQIQRTASGVRPALKKETIDGNEYYILQGLNIGQQKYAYDAKKGEMVVIQPKQSTKVQIYSDKKGGYLRKLRNN